MNEISQIYETGVLIYVGRSVTDSYNPLLHGICSTIYSWGYSHTIQLISDRAMDFYFCKEVQILESVYSINPTRWAYYE